MEELRRERRMTHGDASCTMTRDWKQTKTATSRYLRQYSIFKTFTPKFRRTTMDEQDLAAIVLR
jgi:hypothetical protein